MFGSNYAQNFGLPGFPWTGMDPQGGMFAPPFSGMEQGQPVPGTPGAGASSGGPAAFTSAPDAGLGPAANPSVEALRSGNPLATATFPAGTFGGGTEQFRAAVGAGTSAPPGAGAPTLPGFGRGA